MKEKTLRANNFIREERDSSVWWRCFFGLIGGILLAAGFVYAAGQHFDALEQSAKNVEMRRQREQLKTERQRLVLTHETALSPAQLEKQARKIGMQELTANQIAKVGETEISENAFDTETIAKNGMGKTKAFVQTGKTETSAKQAQQTTKR